MTVSFTVPGVPAPQGSKVRTRYGMREDNPATRPWRQAVAWEATVAMTATRGDVDFMPDSRVAPLVGPLELEAVFYFPRPKSHYRTGKLAGQLKPSAPFHHATKPDGDKLVRAIGDAITGVVCRDDSQIVRCTFEKRYGQPRAEVTVRALELTRKGTA